MELVFTLPILGLLLMGLFEFSLLFFARADVVEACRAGARKATLHGCTREDVESEVRRVLTPRLHEGLLVQTDLGAQSGDLVTIAVSVPMSAAAPDLLWPVGFSLDGRDLYSESRMAKE
jgi:hypothetical protein